MMTSRGVGLVGRDVAWAVGVKKISDKAKPSADA